MTFKKSIVVSILGLACVFAATQSFAAYCMWELKDGSKVKYNIEGSIIAGISDTYIDQLHACCEADPGPCGQYWIGESDLYNVQLAAKYNRTNTVKYLLKYRGCGETVDRFGHPSRPSQYNALMFAINNSNKEMVLWLLHYKADPTVKNGLGKDSKYYAEQTDKTKGDNNEIAKMVMDAWNKVMGYSQNLIREKKEALKKQLNGQDIKEQLKMLNGKYNIRPFIS